MGCGSPTTLSEGALAGCWAGLRTAGRAALIPYITAGHPDWNATRVFLGAARDYGADIVELGVPWSDPVADGRVIQASTHAALAAGVTLRGVLDALREARPAVPVVLFTYLNPVLAMGPSRFLEAAREAGAAGILVVDLPVGSDPATEAALQAGGLPLVRLVAPTTPPPRLARIAAASQGFVYLVARLGVTGASRALAADLGDRVAAVRAATSLPVAVGFGIGGPEQAAAVATLADGVVVGSAVVERMEAGSVAAAGAWLRELRRAMDLARAARA